MGTQDIARAVSALAREKPEWLPVLEAALVVAERCEPYGGDFAGAWVLDELEARTGHRVWLPNLRVLTSYGLLEKAGESTRGGRRAYYHCTERQAITKALSLVTRTHPQSSPSTRPESSRFRFVGAGDSGQQGSDAARKAGEMKYQPRSWR